MVTELTLVLVLCLAGMVVGLLVPRATFLAIFSGCILLYVVSFFAWGMALWLGFVSFDRLLAPVRWTRYEGVVTALIFSGVPSLPPLLLLMFFAGRSFRRRQKRGVQS
jgi:hypothetical protein